MQLTRSHIHCNHRQGPAFEENLNKTARRGTKIHGTSPVESYRKVLDGMKQLISASAHILLWLTDLDSNIGIDLLTRLWFLQPINPD
jgi:hypothetical protein